MRGPWGSWPLLAEASRVGVNMPGQSWLWRRCAMEARGLALAGQRLSTYAACDLGDLMMAIGRRLLCPSQTMQADSRPVC